MIYQRKKLDMQKSSINQNKFHQIKPKILQYSLIFLPRSNRANSLDNFQFTSPSRRLETSKKKSYF